MLFWASWYSGNYADEGCTAPPFKFWNTGTAFRDDDGLTPDRLAEANKIEDEDEYHTFIDTHGRTDCTLCALIEAESEEEVFVLVAKHFPDYRYRFCDESDGNLGDRFLP